MKAKLTIALGMIGLFLSCTLFTAHAVEYRKEKTELVKTTECDYITSAVVETTKLHVCDVNFLAPSNRFEVVLPISFAYLKDYDKPDNRHINGILNKQRICSSEGISRINRE